jgi:hypothetical protein
MVEQRGGTSGGLGNDIGVANGIAGRRQVAGRDD